MSSTSLQILSHSAQDPVTLSQQMKAKAFTGSLRLTHKEHLYESCIIVYHCGDIVYMDTSAKQPLEILDIILKKLNLKFRDAIVDFASKRCQNINSLHELISCAIVTNSVTWDQVKALMKQRITTFLERIFDKVCEVEQIVYNCDIAYGNDKTGFNINDILPEIHRRQLIWQKYASIVESGYLVPIIKNLDGITDKRMCEHFKSWVNGERSFFNIADAIEVDPLSLVATYAPWITQGFIAIRREPKIVNLGVGSVRQVEMPMILVVDDSVIIQTMIKRHLCEEYEVFCASNVAEAMEILDKKQISLIFSDVNMDEVDGFQFCKMVRKISHLREVPIILLTAKDGLINKAIGHLVGATEYLIKPPTKSKILSVVKEYV